MYIFKPIIGVVTNFLFFETLETNEYADLEEREAGSGDAVSKFEERGYVTDEEIEDQKNVDDFEERGFAEEKVEEEQEEEQEERELGDEEYINAQDIQQAGRTACDCLLESFLVLRASFH